MSYNSDNSLRSGLWISRDKKLRVTINLSQLRSAVGGNTIITAGIRYSSANIRVSPGYVTVLAGVRPAVEDAGAVFPYGGISGNTMLGTSSVHASVKSDKLTFKPDALNYAINSDWSGSIALWLYFSGADGSIINENLSTAGLELGYSSGTSVQGAAKPTIPGTGAVTFTNTDASCKALGVNLQGRNSFTATGHATIDDVNYPNLSAEYTLTLCDSAGKAICELTQTDDQEFAIPTINAAGQIKYTYSVTDTANNSVASAMANAFTVTSYTPPAISSLSAERYSTRPADTGGDIDVADNTGDKVRFSFTLTPPVIQGVTNNGWTLSVRATSGSGTTKSKTGVYTGTTTGLNRANDKSIFSTDTFAATDDWTFTFTVTDKISSVSATCQVAKAVSILNIESTGVAIGQFVSTAAAGVPNNILRGTGSPAQVLDKDTDAFWSDGTWGKTGGGNATVSIIQVADCPDSGVTTGFSFSGNTANNKEVAQYQVPLTAGQTYTASCWARVPSGSAVLNSYIYDHTANALSARVVNRQTISNKAWQHYSGSFSFSGDADNSSVHFGIYGAGSLEVCGFKLEKGTVANPTWTPAPEEAASTGIPAKRFEVASDFGSVLNGGVWGTGGYRLDYAATSQKLSISSTNFAAETGDWTPVISRVGPIVFLEGAVRCATATGMLGMEGNELTLSTLPAWARPRVTVSHIAQGRDARICWLRILPSGKVMISRNRATNDFFAMAAGDQLFFTAAWLAADAAASVT